MHHANRVVGGKFCVGCMLASGSCGHVYKGINLETGADVAIKFESVKAGHLRLMHEAKVCKLFANSVGLPIVHWYGVEGDYNVVVFDLLGPSLQDLLDYSGGRFSLKTVLMLADQMIARIESVHSRGFVHGTIKPSHFVIGLGANADIIHLIDFGHAQRICASKAQAPPRLTEDQNFNGSLRYISVNAHRGVEQGRRDDLESLGYVLLYFFRGRLPWQGMRASTESEKHELVMDKKLNTCMNELCYRAPREFAEICAYSQGLQRNDVPDYAYLKRSLRNAFCRFGSNYSSHFDWTARASRAETTVCSSRRLQSVIEEGFEQDGQTVCAC
eukprot:TRINITY_DN63985_c0_g1_i1.p1 TRINITY_DN63985_c0_g1~~TRINITY_DN63985_c0_g1_i1.p1  ORF type:complete len:344 (+),score=33.07 TRINITY_DN63985_c0_g1_i1:46-1032(+)